MMTIQALDAAFLLIVVAHTIIMLNRDEQRVWEHFVGRACLAGVGFFATALALSRLSLNVPTGIDFWTRLGFDAAVAVFIVLRVWWPKVTPGLGFNVK